jgi:hypothetical protein
VKPTRFELAIDMKTAETPLPVPQSLRLRADEMIE